MCVYRINMLEDVEQCIGFTDCSLEQALLKNLPFNTKKYKTHIADYDYDDEELEKHIPKKIPYGTHVFPYVYERLYV